MEQIEGLNIDIRLIFAIINGKVSAAISRKLSNDFYLAGFNITPDQWSVLMHLEEQNGVTQQELCNAVYKHKPSMTRLIDTMEAKGFVARLADKTDRRKNTIHLTLLGKETLKKAQKVALLTLKSALRGLSTDELRTSQEVLRKIFANTSQDVEEIEQRQRRGEHLWDFPRR